jgi:hypothetical protein
MVIVLSKMPAVLIAIGLFLAGLAGGIYVSIQESRGGGPAGGVQCSRCGHWHEGVNCRKCDCRADQFAYPNLGSGLP